MLPQLKSLVRFIHLSQIDETVFIYLWPSYFAVWLDSNVLRKYFSMSADQVPRQLCATSGAYFIIGRRISK